MNDTTKTEISAEEIEARRIAVKCFHRVHFDRPLFACGYCHIIVDVWDAARDFYARSRSKRESEAWTAVEDGLPQIESSLWVTIQIDSRLKNEVFEGILRATTWNIHVGGVMQPLTQEESVIAWMLKQPVPKPYTPPEEGEMEGN